MRLDRPSTFPRAPLELMSIVPPTEVSCDRPSTFPRATFSWMTTLPDTLVRLDRPSIFVTVSLLEISKDPVIVAQ